MAYKGGMIDKVIKMIEDVLEIKTNFPPNEHFCKVMSSGKAVLHNMQKLVNDTYKPPQLEGHGFMEGHYEKPVRSNALPRPVWSMNENDIIVHRDNVDEDSKIIWNGSPPMPQYQNARGIVSDNGVPPAEEQGRNKEKGMTPEPEAVNHGRLLSDTGFHDQIYPEEQGRDKAEAVNDSSSQPDVDNCDQFESSQMEWGPSILDGSLLEADPFGLLIVLLSVSIGLNLELFKDISALSFVFSSLQNLFLIKQLKRDKDELVLCVPTGISKMADTERDPAYGETCIYSGCDSDTISLFKFGK